MGVPVREAANRLGLRCRQGDDIGQALQQQFQLMSVQSLVALAAKVMTDILVEFLAQQPVLLLQTRILFAQAGVVGLQRGDTRTQFFHFLEQRGVGHASLTGIQTVVQTLSKNVSPPIPTGLFDCTSSP